MSSTSPTKGKGRSNLSPLYYAQLLESRFEATGDQITCQVSLNGEIRAKSPFTPPSQRWTATAKPTAKNRRKYLFKVNLTRDDADAAVKALRERRARGETFPIPEGKAKHKIEAYIDSLVEATKSGLHQEVEYSVAASILMFTHNLDWRMEEWSLQPSTAFIFHQGDHHCRLRVSPTKSKGKNSLSPEVPLSGTELTDESVEPSDGDEHDGDDDEDNGEGNGDDDDDDDDNGEGNDEGNDDDNNDDSEGMFAISMSSTRTSLTIQSQHPGSTNPPRCLIFEGVPGTGKTFALNPLQSKAARDDYGAVGDDAFAITLHPATAYEDFVEGLRPTAAPPPQGGGNGGETTIHTGVLGDKVAGTDNRYIWHERPCDKPYYHTPAPPTGNTTFSVTEGFFVRCCREAIKQPEKWFIVLLDEINRCNIPKVFGDLLTTIEQSKRARWVTITEGGETKQGWDLSNAQTVTLPYSGRTFFVPDNIIVIGTMNTTDRSVAPMDAALRRRFAFMRVWPFGFGPTVQNIDTEKILNDEDKLNAGDLAPYLRPSVELWFAINTRLHAFGDDALLGHSYLFGLLSELSAAEGDTEKMEQAILFHWNHYIFPQIIDIIQSNDLEGRVFKGTGTAGGELKDLSWKSGNEKEKEKETTGLFEGTLPKGIEGKWTSRGEGMLRTLTLRLTAAGRVDKVATATQFEAAKDEPGTEQATEENSDSKAAGPAQA